MIAYRGRRRQPGLLYAFHDSLVELARACDVFVVVASGNAGTAPLVTADILAALGSDGILISVACGSFVDELALIAALERGTIHAAGLDVFAEEPHVLGALMALDNVVLLPHVGSASAHTRRRMGALVIENLMSWFEGNGPVTPVVETPWPT